VSQIVDAEKPCPKCKSKLELHIRKDKDVSEVWCANCKAFLGLEISAPTTAKLESASKQKAFRG